MVFKCLYDFYLDGVENGKQFGYIPDFSSPESIQAYTMGYSDCKNNKIKDIYEFEKIFKD